MSENKVAFLPFNAINEFMLDDYRQSVILSVFQSLPEMDEKQKSRLNQLTKKLIQVPGFRNSLQAPLGIKARHAEKIFEKNALFVAAVISAWAQMRPELRQQVFDLLTERGWELLPVDADRAELPGFLPRWPKDDDFEALTLAFKQRYPESNVADNDVSLMVVWLSDSLPYEKDDADTAPDDGDSV
jgi:hypothetical protein